MNQAQLQYFLSAFKYRNISKAAEEQHVTRQALSRSLADMENELGYQLFVRSKDGVKPTQAAYNILPHVKTIQEEFSRMYTNKTILDMTNKEITVCVFDSFMEYLTKDFFESFIEKYPDILLNVESYSDREAVEQLAMKQCVFAIATDAVDLSSFSKKFLYRARYGCLINRKNPLSEKEIISIDDLKGQSLIGKSRKIAYYTRDLNGLIELGLDMTFIIEVDSSFIARQMVEDNMGIALMWDYTDPKLLEGTDIVPRPIHSKNWGCDVFMAYNKDEKLTRKQQLVMNAFVEWCAEKEKNWEEEQE